MFFGCVQEVQDLQTDLLERLREALETYTATISSKVQQIFFTEHSAELAISLAPVSMMQIEHVDLDSVLIYM